jgi:nucleoside-diphosphate-sugar epimerase
MRIALTGTTGFLGRHLVPAALSAGHQIRALVRYGKVAPVGVEVVQGELGYPEALRQLVKGADVAIHLAAVGVQARGRDWHRMTKVNVAEPLALAEACAAAKVARLVTVGTCLEYRGHGKLPETRGPDGSLCGEDDALEADEPYGAAKAAGGLLIRSYARSLALPCWYLRLAPIYGAGDDPQKVLPAAVRAALEKRPFATTLGEQVREWLHVDDAVGALLAAAAADPPGGGEVINVGTGQQETLRSVVGRVFALAGAEQSLIQAGTYPYRRGEAHRLVMSTERARRALKGWVPRTALDQGLARLVAEGG